MADKQPLDEAKIEEERSALQTFERILEIMPDDRGALEAAILAAQACGESDKALLHRLRLADLLLDAGEPDALRDLADALRSDPDPRARAWIDAYDRSPSASRPLPADAALDVQIETPGRPAPASPLASFNISDEIELAWKLFDHREISQEEYSALVRDLTEMSATQHAGTVSVLHALEAGNHKNQDRILAFLAQEAEAVGIPFISLSCFTMRAELAHFLPNDFSVNRGALVFETLGKERLVAVLNPFSQSLKADTQRLVGHPCHFYLVKASDFDDALQRLRQAAESALL